MITYRITSKSTNQTPETTSDRLKNRVLARASTKAAKDFPVGCTVVFGGSGRKAEVLAVHTEMENVHWKKLKPFFIRIKFLDNDQVVLCHGSSLRRKSK